MHCISSQLRFAAFVHLIPSRLSRSTKKRTRSRIHDALKSWPDQMHQRKSRRVSYTPSCSLDSSPPFSSLCQSPISIIQPATLPSDVKSSTIDGRSSRHVYSIRTCSRSAIPPSLDRRRSFWAEATGSATLSRRMRHLVLFRQQVAPCLHRHRHRHRLPLPRRLPARVVTLAQRTFCDQAMA